MLKQVSIVDDDQQVTKLLSLLVKKNGFKPKTYTHVEPFLNQDHSSQEIIILDLCMPNMDGIEVIRQLAKKNCRSPLILISGQDECVLKAAQTLANEHNLECVDILLKPINSSDLSKALRKYGEEDTYLKNNVTPIWIPTRHELINALQNKQLILHYQPQINIASGKINSVEALVRWQHPEKGLIFPDQFIRRCEEEDLIEVLTEQVIEIAISESQKWAKNGLTLNMSVNVSAKNISSLSLPEYLSRLIKDKHLVSSLVTLEVTESQLMGELVTSLDTLTRLRMKGFGLSIDDFGTGYSSLSQLHKVPFSELKIDRSFVFNMTTDKDALAIVETCIMLSHKLGMLCVAEGVEEKEHLDTLAELGCDIAQGYYFARPMEGDKICNWAFQNQRLVANG